MMEIKVNAVAKPADSLVIVQMWSLNRLLSFACCPTCKQSGITFSLVDRKEMGFAVKCRLFCGLCEQSFSEAFLSERVGGSKSSKAPFEVNVRSTFAFMGIGCGYSAIRDWSSVMNTPSCMSKLAFQGAKSNIISGGRKSFEEISKRSVEKIHERYGELGILLDKDIVLDNAVSYAGSWNHRGNSSHNGLGVVIDLLTGLPIDFQVLSIFCLQCCKAPEKDHLAYTGWPTNHTSIYDKNYDGSANSMEQQCILLI